MNTLVGNQKLKNWNQNNDKQVIINENIDFLTKENQLIQNGLNDLKLNKTSTHDEVKKRFELKFSKK